jgi:hypothetical protein
VETTKEKTFLDLVFKGRTFITLETDDLLILTEFTKKLKSDQIE